MNLADWADVFTIVGGVATAVLVVPAAFAVLQYFRNSRRQRAQWLADLFERFYEGEAYREVRRHVEWVDENTLRSALSDDPDLEQKWTDYLNFFEFIAYLQKVGELKSEDVDAMFRYWIDQLRPFQGHLAEYGYENLVQLLRERTSEGATK